MDKTLAAPYRTLLLAQRASLLAQLATLRGGAALGQAGLESKAAHSVPANRRDAEAMTMAAATTISSSDSAMAASGSVSR